MALFNWGKIKTNQGTLTRTWIEDCLKEMGNQNILFQNECQLQFLLAWAIQNFFQGKYDIYLEECTFAINSPKLERWYTDIIVEDKETEECIAIELKYKTAKLCDNIGKVILLEQSAEDFGKFDFLWDVNRNEMLVYENQKLLSEENAIIDSNNYRNNPITFSSNACEFKRPGKIKKAYSIMLTNCEKYWVPGKPTQADDFKIAQGRDIQANQNLRWELQKGKIKSDNIRNTKRGRTLCFLKDYQCEWKAYHTFTNYAKNGGKKAKKNNNEFKFLIIEI